MAVTVAVALGDAMRQKGLRVKDVAEAVPVHRAEVSRILHGQRPAIRPLMREIAHKVGSAKLWQVVTYEATEGLFTAPWPDGVGKDIHPAVAYLRCAAARQKASQAMDELAGLVARSQTWSSDTQAIQRLAMDLVSAHRWEQTLVSVLCDWAGIDVARLYRQHDEVLLTQGDVSWRKAA